MALRSGAPDPGRHPGPGGAALSQSPQANIPTPQLVFFRPDLGVPVLAVETETDLLQLGYLAAQQADSRGFRLWELAGTSHADNYETNIGAGDNGSGAEGLAELESMLNPPAGAAGVTCATPINTGEEHYVLDAAQYWLNRWVRTGQAPPAPPLLKVNTPPSPPTFVTDANGNVEGGVRTPAVDVPVATLSGLGQSGSAFCFLFGTTVPFSAAKLAALYPTHLQFVLRWAEHAPSGRAHGHRETADIDLVRAQLLVAAGWPLGAILGPAGAGAGGVAARRHSIQLRINAEDPAAEFAPATGRLTAFRPPSGPGVRLDAGVRTGSVIGDQFDSLMAKLVISQRGAVRSTAPARGRAGRGGRRCSRGAPCG